MPPPVARYQKWSRPLEGLSPRAGAKPRAESQARLVKAALAQARVLLGGGHYVGVSPREHGIEHGVASLIDRG